MLKTMTLLLVCVQLVMTFASAFAQDMIQIAQSPNTRTQTPPPATDTPKPAEYYIIKLKYLSVEQVADFFKKGGRYERMIPATVESIAGMPAMQSIALKTSNPQDVLTLTRLIIQLDQPARSYVITCTAVITDETIQPVFTDTDKSVPTRGLSERLRQLISRRQASVILYPSLRLDLNERGELALQDNTSYFQFMHDQVQLNPQMLLPTAPFFRIAQIKQISDNRIDCQFSIAHIKLPVTAPGQSVSSAAGGSVEYQIDKVDTLTFMNDNTNIAYTGMVKGEHAAYRLYLLMRIYRIELWR